MGKSMTQSTSRMVISGAVKSEYYKLEISNEPRSCQCDKNAIMSNYLTEQVGEVSLVQSMFYNDEFVWLDPVSGACSQVIRVFIRNQFLQNPEFEAPEDIHFEFKLRVDTDSERGIAWLFVLLPTSYPTASPQIYISTLKLSRQTQASLNEAIADYLEAHAGESCIHEIYELVHEKALQISDEELDSQKRSDHAMPEESISTEENRPQIGRALLWMHHIKNPNKRKDIVNWGEELQLNGFSKPGYPGIVVVEGLYENVEEYISRLKALRWQAIAVRYRESEFVDDVNKLDCYRRIRHAEGKVGVLEVENMSAISTVMREVGLEEMFLSALKIQK
ncbi:DUF1115-domain-containing protein [Basidiobolus meristosporus CBS 931.73]|uniref:DUF1115-domain-containing protein n=1 Tax=Basidiobolus meristosporus CBS 931.73 TaxID=1314790 RepID=A0A1Y1Y5X7_9FUNG|nr:DUF1115-domain-containing protein [Basidiobolus meristosporus CBS 931.73]|eukprot:ORX93388.1 DUF1115-domain-containing protein [Basidiobolus meristosporus CBS 931.73]